MPSQVIAYGQPSFIRYLPGGYFSPSSRITLGRFLSQLLNFLLLLIYDEGNKPEVRVLDIFAKFWLDMAHAKSDHASGWDLIRRFSSSRFSAKTLGEKVSSS